MSPIQRLKQGLWSLIYPVFPHLEHTVLSAHSKRRQRYHIGWLSPRHTLSELKHHLATHHRFGNHFVAWEDQDQVLSWRRFDGFEYQYHLRVFNDGEIRGHYERTPESAPVAHFLEKGETARTRQFLKFLGPYVTKTKHLQMPLLKRQHTHRGEISFVVAKEK